MDRGCAPVQFNRNVFFADGKVMSVRAAYHIAGHESHYLRLYNLKVIRERYL